LILIIKEGINDHDMSQMILIKSIPLCHQQYQNDIVDFRIRQIICWINNI